jgi:hypothetical protein
MSELLIQLNSQLDQEAKHRDSIGLLKGGFSLINTMDELSSSSASTYVEGVAKVVNWREESKRNRLESNCYQEPINNSTMSRADAIRTRPQCEHWWLLFCTDDL